MPPQPLTAPTGIDVVVLVGATLRLSHPSPRFPGRAHLGTVDAVLLVVDVLGEVVDVVLEEGR